jgi:multisubunit Na+/H+ antiporter MnhG subunit
LTFLLTAFLLLSLALVAVLAVAFEGNPFNWFFGFLIVGFVWLVIGGIAAYSAMRALTEKGVVPRRTMQILNGDKAWLQREAKNVL